MSSIDRADLHRQIDELSPELMPSVLKQLAALTPGRTETIDARPPA